MTVAEPETSQPAAQSDPAAKKPWQGSGPGGFSWKAIVLAALGIYALLLIIQNSRSVSVSFVFFSQKTRVIYLVLLCMALGALIMWFIPRLRHGRKEKRSSSAKQNDAKTGQRSGPGGISWKAIVLAALGIYALLLIILNAKTVSLDFVFFSQKTRVVFLVLLSMALGALIMWLVPRMRHGRKEKSPASVPASPPDDGRPTSGADVSPDSG
jgi:uncharacterized integral membrane protein